MSRIGPRVHSGAAAQAPRARLGLAEVPGLLRRSWARLVLPTAVAAVGAALCLQVVPPRFTGEAKVLLESREPAAPIDDQALAGEARAVASRDLAREAIRQLKLVGNPEFDAGIGPVRQGLARLGIGGGQGRSPEDRVLEAYLDRLAVTPAATSNVLTVAFDAHDPALAAASANAAAELYVAALEAAKGDPVRRASARPGGTIEGLRRSTAEAEAKVEAFRARNGLPGTTAGRPLTAQQLGDLSSQLSQARTLRADLAGRVQAIKEMVKDGRAFEIPDIASNEVIRRTVENRIGVRAQLALESRTLLSAHPRIKELTAQLADLDAQLKAAAERVGRTLENDLKSAGARIESLQAAVDGQQDVVVKGNAAQVQLRVLEREAKAQREQLDAALSRPREGGARESGITVPVDARIVSRAVAPEQPSFPQAVPTVLLAAALGLMAGLGTVLARALRAGPAAAAEGTAEAAAAEAGAAVSPRIEGRFDLPEALPPGRWASGATASLGPSLAAYVTPTTGFAASAPGTSLIAISASETSAPETGVPETSVSETSAAEVTPLAAAASGTDAVIAAEPVAVPDLVAGPNLVAVPDLIAGPAPQPAPRVRIVAPARPIRPAADRSAYDLAPLVARLRTCPRTTAGRTVLVFEAEASGPAGAVGGGLAAALAADLGEHDATLLVDVNGPADLDTPGLRDLVAGEAAFLEAIQAEPGVALHRVGPGLGDAEVLFEEPQALAIAVEAMAEAYAWVVCRVRTDPDAIDLLALVGSCVDGVVIASDASADDPALCELFGVAEESGAGLVVVAQNRTAAAIAADEVAPPILRLVAA